MSAITSNGYMPALLPPAAPRPTVPDVQEPLPVHTEAPSQVAVPAQASPPKDKSTTDGLQAEEVRRAHIERAAENYKALFPVSDMRFTIYKDINGQYITRFTNLLDGRVTQIPEPELLAAMEHSEPVFRTQA